MSADSILGWTLVIAALRAAKALSATFDQRRIEARRAADLRGRA